ncbi:hypothetical protein [Haloplanus salilacus]|uniref:hypothetical protein n=1 Tax=Haloplanus salilacus TaxID=2949994 RepID=UPI0030CA6A46
MKIDPANGSDTDAERPDAVEADGGAEAEARLADDGDTEPEASLVDESTGAETDDADESAVVDAAEPLTITLPDGSESVSEAILSNRRMLTNPDEHDLVSAGELEEVRDAVDTLSTEVSDDLRDEVATLETSLEEVEKHIDRQGRQIEELRDTVTSLAEILGASVEFQETE